MSTGSTTADAAALPGVVAELADALTADLTVEDVAQLLGPVENDPGIPLEVVLRPSSALLAAAAVGRFPDSGLPYTVTLRPAAGFVVTPALLAASFGDYRRTPTDRGRPAELVFARRTAGPRWSVVLMIQVESQASDLDDASVTSITLRRDEE
ncbi:MAG: hypothetical protein AAGC49_14310 [Brevundimonas sp.]